MSEYRPAYDKRTKARRGLYLDGDSMEQSLPERKRLSRPPLWISNLISTGIDCAKLGLFPQAKMLSRFARHEKRQQYTAYPDRKRLILRY
jgi:hypothetical protein